MSNWTCTASRCFSASALGLVIFSIVAASHAEERTDDSAAHNRGYVGSQACAACHREVYASWRSTRHSYSVLMAAEAQQNGVPFPRNAPGKLKVSIHDWEDLAYTIGGRKRTTYIDQAGRVLGTSYHHRTGTWTAFPADKEWSDCLVCHTTGADRSADPRSASSAPVSWTEMNIGCEACHGPGLRHQQTEEKEDIVVDVSAQACGQCHTSTDRVLPRDDLHTTHDQVQAWNHDPHMTGTRFYSHNRLCARCHSPYEAEFMNSVSASQHQVHAEHKNNITCIACHNPHQVTNDGYSREQAALFAPLPANLHTYHGNDDDFTTTDYESFSKSEEVCLQCHKGADRIDLDHANATCTDCHNGFSHNHSPESRVLHDANHPRLSCRRCHQDADHLVSIVFGGPDFLQPKHIHNLRKLPFAVREKYGFRYARMRRFESALPMASDGMANNTSEGLQSQMFHPAEMLSRPLHQRAADRIQQLLASRPHCDFTNSDEIQSFQKAVVEQPNRISRYLDLARAYSSRNHEVAGQQVVQLASHVATTHVLLEIPFDGLRPHPTGQQRGGFSDPLPELTSLMKGSAAGFWLRGFSALCKGYFDEAEATFTTALQFPDSNVNLNFYLALSQAGQQRYEEAIETLKDVLEQQPGHIPSRVALGFVDLLRGRFTPARKQLELALDSAPHDPVANFILGRGYLNQRDADRAIETLSAAVSAAPDVLEFWFALAAAYRQRGQIQAAVHTYEAVIDRWPRQFDARYQLANLLKLTSDQMVFQHRQLVESAPPADVSSRRWEKYLSNTPQQTTTVRDLALSQFAVALSLRPADSLTLLQIGEIYYRSGRWDESRQLFESLAGRQPDRWRHRYRLGTIHIQVGEYQLAARSLERALALAPTQGDCYAALGLTYARSGRTTEAVDIFQRGIIYQPFNPGLHTNLGAAQGVLGHYDEALRALQRSLELATFPLPRLHLTHTNVGLVHLKQRRRQEAMRAFRQALFIFPDYPPARRMLDFAEAHDVTTANLLDASQDFVFNDMLDPFGEVTTVSLGE